MRDSVTAGTPGLQTREASARPYLPCPMRRHQWTDMSHITATALTSGTSVSWDAGSNQSAVLVLGHNATIANATNHANGGVYILKVTQDSSPKTLSWNSNYKWPGNSAPTMTATAGAVDVFTFVSDGTYMYGSFSGSQNFT